MVTQTSPWLPAFAPFLVAAAVCIATMPIAVVMARWLGAIAHPDDERHIHSDSTPRLGGIAMFLGFGAAVAIFGASLSVRWQVVAVCAAITVLMVVDDLLDLSPWAKLIIEMAAGIAVALSGIVITYFALPGSNHLIDLAWLSFPITVVWVMGMQVSINFLDGSDGVAAGVVAIVALVSLLAAVNRFDAAPDTQNGVIIMSGALMGCCFGFLVFNLPPARVFMGDSGSHFLGVAVAMITILGVSKVAVGVSLLVPLITLGLPISDTAFAIVRRRRAGLSPAQPDAGHLHHRLLARGMTPMETALTFYFSTAILGCIGLALFGHRRVLDVAFVLLIVALATVWVRTHRRVSRAKFDEDGFMLVEGHRAEPASSRGEHTHS